MQASLELLTCAKGRDELFRGKAQMHEVAKAAAIALPVFVLAAARFTEVGDG